MQAARRKLSCEAYVAQQVSGYNTDDTVRSKYSMRLSEEALWTSKVLQYAVAKNDVGTLVVNRPHNVGLNHTKSVYRRVRRAGSIHVKANHLRNPTAKVSKSASKCNGITSMLATTATKVHNYGIRSCHCIDTRVELNHSITPCNAPKGSLRIIPRLICSQAHNLVGSPSLDP